MKRRKFVLLFGFMLILIVCYAGWCAREFFIHPKIERGPYVPDEAWTVIEEHFAVEGFPVPHFSWPRYCDRLIHPYEGTLGPARTWVRFEDEIYVYHRGIDVLFRKTKSNHWKSDGVHREKN
jgi:hypothetical protein